MYVLMVDLYTEPKGEASNCDTLSYVYLHVTSWHLDCTTVCDFSRQRGLVESILLDSVHLESASYTMFFVYIARNAYCDYLQRQRYVEIWVIPPLLTSFVTLWLGTRSSPLGIMCTWYPRVCGSYILGWEGAVAFHSWCVRQVFFMRYGLYSPLITSRFHCAFKYLHCTHEVLSQLASSLVSRPVYARAPLPVRLFAF